MMELYLQHGQAGSPMLTEKVEHKIDPLWWQEKGLSYTASGYGSKIPTHYKVKYNNRWLRVYAACYSNLASLYIVSKGKDITVTEY